MVKYDDFAMPSLENIENMAKAYAEMEKQYIEEKKKNCCEDYNSLQQIYENIYCSFDILNKISAIYPKNRKFTILCEKVTKLKLEFESEFVKYELKLPNTKYTFAESTIIFDLIKQWAEVASLCLNNVKDVNKSKYFTLKHIELIREVIKY
ncbi:MAG: hypothetical protein IJZ29_00120 [Clostridia bacterium]|nr:hypothetical protein [Clostridia bacterium]